ncbi:lipoprotein-releasing ABC transporter permease subunit [Arenimonas fontis]|uniref:Lipoprotein-releasing ABC transporter permease subunit n=1 Tax=Arenimonas fontis TaxID=2608255 RepID=A0A5B2ZB91_9GAMM|nr:lipoprotein-releasing ABC transporter permease subunit [Arenimonas fontis]KAA2284434.1 lipoprotein-releasing ABC transporter permease subunit [Arenimonas fontis]
MFQPLSVAIGLRYLRAKRRNGFISFLSLASILGIILGVVALITTIAVMSGFQQELRERILGMVAHATVSGVDGPLQDWPRAVELADEDPRVLGAAPYVETEALIQGRRRQGALLRGVDPALEPRVSQLADKMRQGRLEDLRPGEYRILLGVELAMVLGVQVGDQVNVFISQATVTPLGAMPRARRFTVAGIFEAGAQEYDLGLAVIHLQDAQALTRMGEGVSGVRLRLDDLWDAWNVARDLADRLDDGFYRVRDWSRDHANFFRALKMEKTVMFILLSLVILIAAFNLVSSLVMLVQDKQSDIAILRTLGMSPGAVMRVFVVQGLVVGVAGIAVGVAAGVALASNLSHVVAFVEDLFDTELMPSDVYYISGVPSVVNVSDVLMVAAVAFVMCLLATLYPAWRASRTDPATALRYE